MSEAGQTRPTNWLSLTALRGYSLTAPFPMGSASVTPATTRPAVIPPTYGSGPMPTTPLTAKPKGEGTKRVAMPTGHGYAPNVLRAGMLTDRGYTPSHARGATIMGCARIQNSAQGQKQSGPLVERESK